MVRRKCMISGCLDYVEAETEWKHQAARLDHIKRFHVKMYNKLKAEGAYEPRDRRKT